MIHHGPTNAPFPGSFPDPGRAGLPAGQQAGPANPFAPRDPRADWWQWLTATPWTHAITLTRPPGRGLDEPHGDAALARLMHIIARQTLGSRAIERGAEVAAVLVPEEHADGRSHWHGVMRIPDAPRNPAWETRAASVWSPSGRPDLDLFHCYPINMDEARRAAETARVIDYAHKHRDAHERSRIWGRHDHGPVA